VLVKLQAERSPSVRGWLRTAATEARRLPGPVSPDPGVAGYLAQRDDYQRSESVGLIDRFKRGAARSNKARSTFSPASHSELVPASRAAFLDSPYRHNSSHDRAETLSVAVACFSTREKSPIEGLAGEEAE
jgi:hypothetical protein